MNVTLWILQILLALHTVMGAIWKFSNPAASAVPSLKAIPHGGWIGLSVLEIVCAVALVLPLMMKPMGNLAPIAACVIAAEMALFSIVHLSSGAGFNGQVVYWVAVAVFCAVIAYGRFVLKPI